MSSHLHYFLSEAPYDTISEIFIIILEVSISAIIIWNYYLKYCFLFCFHQANLAHSYMLLIVLLVAEKLKAFCFVNND